MKKESDTFFGILKNIENACRFVRESGSVTVCRIGMLPLLLELYRAIEFYERLADDFQNYELPQDVTVSDFEYWAHRMNPNIPDSPTACLFLWRKEDERRLSMKDDRAVLQKVSRDLLPPAGCKNDEEHRFVFRDTVESLRENLEQWNLEDAVYLGFSRLADALNRIVHALDSPADSALRSLYADFLEHTVLERPGDPWRRWKLWKIDHENRSDYGRLLDAWIAKLRTEIDAEPYGGMEWDRFFESKGDWMTVACEEVGRLLWRNLKQYKEDDGLACRLFEHLGLWESAHTERLRLMGQKTKTTSCLSKALEENREAMALFVQILKDIYATVNSGKGKHSERRSWIHVYHAWNRLGFLQGEFVPKHFGETVFAICDQRSADSIEKTFAKKDYSEKHLTDSDRERIAELEALFRPVRERLDGSDARAGSPER